MKQYWHFTVKQTKRIYWSKPIMFQLKYRSVFNKIPPPIQCYPYLTYPGLLYSPSVHIHQLTANCMDSSSENKTEDNTADFPAQHSKDSLSLPLYLWGLEGNVWICKRQGKKKKIPQATIYITHHIQM